MMAILILSLLTSPLSTSILIATVHSGQTLFMQSLLFTPHRLHPASPYTVLFFYSVPQSSLFHVRVTQDKYLTSAKKRSSLEREKEFEMFI